MIPRRRTNVFHPVFDILEERAVPAGNVCVSLVGTELLIQGNNAANQVVLQRTDAAITIQGVGITTINKGASVSYSTGQVQTITTKLGKGDDNFSVQASYTFPSANLRLQVTDDCGNDSVQIDGLRGSISINTGRGNDSVILLNIMAGSVAINTGCGEDSVNVEFLANVPLSINTGNGNDQVSIMHAQPLNLSIATGNGADDVRLEYVVRQGDLQINTGKGTDHVALRHVQFASGLVDGGGSKGDVFEDLGENSGLTFVNFP